MLHAIYCAGCRAARQALFSTSLSACSALTARGRGRAGKAQGLNQQLREERRSWANDAGMRQAPVILGDTLPWMSVKTHACLPCNGNMQGSCAVHDLAKAYQGSKQDHLLAN